MARVCFNKKRGMIKEFKYNTKLAYKHSKSKVVNNFIEENK